MLRRALELVLNENSPASVAAVCSTPLLQRHGRGGDGGSSSSSSSSRPPEGGQSIRSRAELDDDGSRRTALSTTSCSGLGAAGIVIRINLDCSLLCN